MPRFEATRKNLLSAGSDREIERVLFEAIGQVDPDELRLLPPECLAVVASRRADMHDAAVTLLQYDLKHHGEEAVGVLLQQLAQVYAAASVRLSQIEQWRDKAPLLKASNSD